MRISKMADYGTVVMVYLAKHTDVLSTARDIAHQTHLNLPTVSKILKRLTSAGLLISVRGALGGYQLQRDATTISVADIVAALDNVSGLTECSLQPNVCALQSVCDVQGHWRSISHIIAEALRGVRLDVLAKPVKPMTVGVNRG